MKKPIFISSWLVCLVIALFMLGGCTKTSPKEDQPAVDKNITQTVTLYFSDDQAMYLIPETRKITIAQTNPDTVTIAKAITEELIAGPSNKNLAATIPAETKLLSLKIVDQTAYVNFSEEIRSKHPGGSSGELMTLNSLVDSLTELKDIKKVLVLIEGQKVDTLVGQADLTQPLTRDESIIKK